MQLLKTKKVTAAATLIGLTACPAWTGRGLQVEGAGVLVKLNRMA